MDQKKKEIIVSEIKYWKEHRLLPEHYCNYLFALYTEGEEELEQSARKTPKNVVLHTLFVISIIILIALLPLTYLFIYFTELQIVLQIPLYLFFIIVNLLATWILYKKNNFLFQVTLITAALILFLTSVYTVNLLFDNGLVNLIIIMCHCFLWIGIGYKLQLKYFQIAGLLSIIFLIIYFFLSI